MAGNATRGAVSTSGSSKPSPRAKYQKQVTFELLLPVPQHRARLPMRVMISPHDTTDSIITTVKNFYGLYDGPGVSFQDREGNILIAAFGNFDNNMTVFVKVTQEEPVLVEAKIERSPRNSASPRKPKLGAPFEMRPPMNPSRGQIQANRSPSPSSNRSHRSVSTTVGGKPRVRASRSLDPAGFLDTNEENFSDSDGGNGSVSSSRRELHASAEISVDNIVEGGRRKRAKFESSELPLFVPPQVPVTTSLSSVSPQRRAHGDAASPLPFSNQRSFAYNQAMPSPQSYGKSEGQYMQMASSGGIYGQTLPYNGHQLRGRGSAINYMPPRQSTGGILPTPEPTVGSVISDEDVALQLMRLGDASNFSSHGRTSTSTADDALSGKADAASSAEESEEEEESDIHTTQVHSHVHQKREHSVGPRRKKQRMQEEAVHSDSVESSEEDYNDDSFKGESDDVVPEQENGITTFHKISKSKIGVKSRGSVSSVSGSTKSSKSRAPTSISTKVKTTNKVPMSPASITPHSRKASLASISNPLGPDEEDLSAKPRCQRCRKSKKGCDRQRPCGRCKDAGIGIEGCVSEDEGNGRRGRYGRHMGVSIKKDDMDVTNDDEESPVHAGALPHGQFLTPALPAGQGKKRKR